LRNVRVKGDAVKRRCGNLLVDISKARELLGWLPPVSVDERLFDLSVGVCTGVVLLLPLVLVALAVRLTSNGPALYGPSSFRVELDLKNIM